MPTFHQPDDEDRARAEVIAAKESEVDERDAEDGVRREAPPSSRKDPNAPDAPKT